MFLELFFALIFEVLIRQIYNFLFDSELFMNRILNICFDQVKFNDLIFASIEF